MSLGIKKGGYVASASTQLQILLTMKESPDEHIQAIRANFENAKFCLIPSESGEALIWAAQSGKDVVLCYCPSPDRETWRVRLCSWEI